MATWRDDRIGSAHRGENPLVMARMRSGFAVIGDTQHLPGYSVLLCDDARINHLTDLAWAQRIAFLFDLSLLGEAVQAACQGDGLRRINYEILGNAEPWLHGHVFPRYEWEPGDHLEWPVAHYPAAERNAPEHRFDADVHRGLRRRITRELERVMHMAYARPASNEGA